jgi:Acetoacetate decarboxylase (ADC)
MVVRSLTVRGNLIALADLCQTVFGDPRPGEVGIWARSDRVAFDWVQLDLPASQVTEQNERLDTQFLVARIDVTLRAADGKAGSGVFCPFVFSNNSSVVSLLRELLGVPALWTAFDWTGGRMVVRTSVLPKDGDTVDPSGFLMAIDWNPEPDGGPPRDGRPQPLPLPQTVGFVHLKQMRDAVDPTRASLQDLVSGRCQFMVTGRVKKWADSKITIHDYRSLAVGRDLGICQVEPPSQMECKPIAGWEIALSQLVVNGVEQRALQPPPSPGSRSPFRERRGDPQLPPVYSFTDVQITGYRLRADPEQLQRLCDRYLNEPFPDREYVYRPATPNVVVEVLKYGAMTSSRPPRGIEPTDKDSQHELIFRILVGRSEDGSSAARDPRVFCPVVVVDSAWSQISGREVLGYPKLIGHFDDLYVSLGKSKLIEIKTTSLPGLTPDAVQSIGLWTADDLHDANIDPDSFLKAFLGGNQRGTLQLKQLRDATDPRSVRSRELVRGNFAIRPRSFSLPLERVDLTLDQSLAIAFGLPRMLVVPYGSWYRVQCDFDLQVEDPLRP